MEEYNFGKKLMVIVVHQMFTVLMITSIYFLGYLQWESLPGSGAGVLYGMITVAGLVGSMLSLAYLTNTAGKKSEDDPKIYYSWIERIHTDVLAVLFSFLIYGIIKLIWSLHGQRFELAGLLVAAGTLAYVIDSVFLPIYLSMVRRMKGGILLKQSLMYKMWDLICRAASSRRLFSSIFFVKIFCLAMLFLGIGMIGIWRNPWGYALIIPVIILDVYQFFRKSYEQVKIQKALEAIAGGELDTHLNTDEFHGQEREVAQSVNYVRTGLSEAVIESIKNERMKADLITNVSHDIKTPLTSIVNYVDLLKRENLKNEKAQNYIRVLDEKSQRLKQLTEDLVEASRISSGNVKLDMQKIDFVELIYQASGEFNERFEERNLTIVTKLPNVSVMIQADGRQLYRVIENLYTNVAKYAMEKTRVYVDLYIEGSQVYFMMKNISTKQVEVAENELTERFVRGERSRTTEGSGLGLSIAKNLTLMMGGTFQIKVEGDLFVSIISFPTE